MARTQSSTFYGDLGFDELENVFSPVDSEPMHTPILMETSPRLAQDKANETWPHEPLRERLIHLFFQHVYPMCPVVDELQFNQLYLKSSYTNFFRHFPVGLFQAMMFAAVQVRPDSRLHFGLH